MTEDEYILATNFAKINSAVDIVRDMMSGDDHGVDTNMYAQAMSLLTTIQQDIYNSLSSPLGDHK